MESDRWRQQQVIYSNDPEESLTIDINNNNNKVCSYNCITLVVSSRIIWCTAVLNRVYIKGQEYCRSQMKKVLISLVPLISLEN